jgi:sulfoxide reductase heme-binding subunit YedZ
VSHEYWYISRAAGFTAYLLLFASVVLGIANGTRFADRIFRRNNIFDMHRFTAIVSLFFVAFHAFILLGDGYFHIGPIQLLVPLTSPYRPWQVAAGIVSMYALALVVASFYVRKYIGYRAWRTLHFVTFALFGGATLHGIMSGTDTNEPWAKGVYLLCGAVVMLLIFYRVQHRVPDESRVRTMRLAGGAGTAIAALVLLLGTGLFTAARPTTLAAVDDLGGESDAEASKASPSNQPFPFLDSFDDDFAGTYVQNQDASASHLTLDGTASGDLNTKIHIELATQTVAGSQRTNVTVNTAEVRDPASGNVVCAGKVTQFDDGFVRVTCTGSGPYAGVNMTLSSRVSGNRDGTFSGALSGSMQHS